MTLKAAPDVYVNNMVFNFKRIQNKFELETWFVWHLIGERVRENTYKKMVFFVVGPLISGYPPPLEHSGSWGFGNFCYW